MKYLITKANLEDKEIVARKEYIYDTFHIYILKDSRMSTEEVTFLKSIPDTEIDLFLIVGHDKSTDEYIRNHYREIKENNVAIISCNTVKFSSLKLLKNKRIYVPQNGDVIQFYNGRNYGFGFDITDEEIMLYRHKDKNIEKMLEHTFRRR